MEWDDITIVNSIPQKNLVFDQTKNELENERLQENENEISYLKKEIRQLKEQQAQQDKRILDNLIKSGILPKVYI